VIAFPIEATFESWRTAAREALIRNLAPSEVTFEQASVNDGKIISGDQRSFFEMDVEIPRANKADATAAIASNASPARSSPPTSINVPKEFIELAKIVSAVREESRWNLLYRLLYRLQFENRQLLGINSDDDVLMANRWFKSVCRDIHKMHAFVRFKEVVIPGTEKSAFAAWYEPEHRIMRLGAPFFMRRFGDRTWSIFSSDESAHWNEKQLLFGKGIARHEFSLEDSVEDLWGTYYTSIFNPARMKPKMMRSEMATKYWSTLPEAKFIPQMLREAPARLQTMALNQNVMAEVPQPDTSMTKFERLLQLENKAKTCRVCSFACSATQTVWGKGSPLAKLMIVGEQPGDHEDRTGQPFVGPAGQLLDCMIEKLGMTREDFYITNAVKHFKFTPTEGGQRLHKKASGREAHACLPWLEAEIDAVQPKVILALGVTAATSILGRLPKLENERGQVLKSQRFDTQVVISWHPSALLRTPDPSVRRSREQMLLIDLKMALQISENL